MRPDREMTGFYIFMGLCAIALIVVLVIGGMAISTTAAASNACLEVGYPRYSFVGGDTYCIRIENGTEVVRPLADITSR